MVGTGVNAECPPFFFTRKLWFSGRVRRYNRKHSTRYKKNGRPATPPVEKKQRPILALYSKDEILTLSRKVYLSVLSDVAAKDKSSASLLVQSCFHKNISKCWLTAASGLAALLQQKPRVQDSGSCLFPFTESDSA